MRVFDLHCDTLTECMKKGEPLRRTTGHLSLEGGAGLGEWTQVFAVFVPDSLQGQAAADYCDRAIDFYHSQLGEIVQSCRPVLAVENANALGGDLYRIDALAKRGVRIITLTWNGENELGYGAHCDPEGGLTLFGKAAVLRMFQLGIHPDLSHLNEAGFWDVALLASRMGRPLLATHSCCAAIHPHPRNLSDQQLRAVIASGGLVGLCLYPEFLGGQGDAEAFFRHLQHVVSLGGQGCVALGSDFDGCTLHPSLAGPQHLPQLDDALAKLGVSAELRDGVFWRNAAGWFF